MDLLDSPNGFLSWLRVPGRKKTWSPAVDYVTKINLIGLWCMLPMVMICHKHAISVQFLVADKKIKKLKSSERCCWQWLYMLTAPWYCYPLQMGLFAIFTSSKWIMQSSQDRVDGARSSVFQMFSGLAFGPIPVGLMIRSFASWHLTW